MQQTLWSMSTNLSAGVGQSDGQYQHTFLEAQQTYRPTSTYFVSDFDILPVIAQHTFPSDFNILPVLAQHTFLSGSRSCVAHSVQHSCFTRNVVFGLNTLLVVFNKLPGSAQHTFRLDQHTSWLGSTHFSVRLNTLPGSAQHTSWFGSTHFLARLNTLPGPAQHTSRPTSTNFSLNINTLSRPTRGPQHKIRMVLKTSLPRSKPHCVL
jgi:hypothetical protein